jgi:hypothetical protein
LRKDPAKARPGAYDDCVIIGKVADARNRRHLFEFEVPSSGYVFGDRLRRAPDIDRSTRRLHPSATACAMASMWP